VSVSSGLIFNVQRFSTMDGPGIRTTVFFKGCPLSCPWCHNPEGLSSSVELVVHETRCIGCGSCVDACPHGVASEGLFDLASCARCGTCAAVCPADARQVVGRRWTASEVRDAVLRDRIFFDDSGGGVTFSGGEPLAQPSFLIACLEACRAVGLATAIDTSGYAPPDVMLAASARADLVLFDLKLVDEEEHQRVIGVPLAPILANLRAVADTSCRIWLRVPIVPGFTDGEGNLHRIVAIAARTPGVERVSLLPYHSTASAKLSRLRLPRPLANPVTPSPDLVTAVAERFRAGGLEVSIGG
jgi:pyruvate formate lyase activating enzyme